MRAVRGANTGPELAVRRLVHAMGYRFRLHRRDLPGKPDIVLPRHRKVIFVHGCFWHRHTCKRGTMPATRRTFWERKLEGNRVRDQRNFRKLRRDGWKVLVVWECWCKRPEYLQRKLERFLES